MLAPRKKNRTLASDALQNPSVKVNPKKSVSNSALLKVIRDQDTDQLQELLEHHSADIVAWRTNAGDGLLHAAAEEGCVASIVALLDAKVSINMHNTLGDRAIDRAVVFSHHAAVELLLDHKAAVHYRSAENYCPLMWATLESDVRMAKLLLKRGARLAYRGDMHTPLTHAVINSAAMTALLLQRKACVNSRGLCKDSKTPLWWAFHHQSPACVKLLLEAGATFGDRKPRITRALLQTTVKPRPEHDDPDARYLCLREALHALQRPHLTAVKLFVRAKLGPFASPCVMRHLCQFVGVHKLLSVARSDRLGSGDGDGDDDDHAWDNLLTVAAKQPAAARNARHVALLLEHDACVLQGGFSYTAADLAGTPEIKKLIQVHTRQVLCKVCPGREPCMTMVDVAVATDGNHTGCARRILELKGDVNQTSTLHYRDTNKRFFPLGLAARNANPHAAEVVKFLMDECVGAKTHG